MATELELKLALTPERLDQLRQHPFLRQYALAPGHKRLLDNTYFDTPERHLLKARVGLRIRRQDGRHIQTLKTSGTAVGGLHDRQEWNVDLPGPELDLSLFPPEALPEALRDGLVQSLLAPVFTTRFEREAWPIRLPGGGEAELALDAGEILVGAARAPICELELELLQGEAPALFAYARELAGLVPMQVANISKAQRGYALAAGETEAAASLPAIRLHESLPVSEGFGRIAGAALGHWQAHELLFLEQDRLERDGDEAVAALAEAVELLRLALSLFSGPVTRRATTALRAELAELDGVLAWFPGYVRAGELEARLAAGNGVYRNLAGRKTLRALVHEDRLTRAQGGVRLRARLDQTEHAQAQLYFGAWLYQRAWTHGVNAKVQAHLEQPLRDFAHDRLNRLWRELYQGFHGERPKRRSDYRDQGLHLSKLRVYSLALCGLFDRGDVRDFCAPWRDIETGLSELAELDYLRGFAARFEGENRADLNGWLDRQEASLMEALEHTRRAALKLKPYWLD